MQIFSQKTLNGRHSLMVTFILNCYDVIANWYEDRLVKEQLFKTKPEMRIVSSR